MPPNPDGHTRKIAYDVNQHVCHAVLDFLDFKLRNQPEALRKLRNELGNIHTAKFTHTSKNTS